MTVIIFAGKDIDGKVAFFMQRFLRDIKDTNEIVYCDNDIDLEKIIKADNIVIFTPTYWFGIPSRLQKLIEDLTVYEDKKFDFLSGKKFACVAYSPHGGDTECITKLGLVFNSWGCEIISCGLMYFRSMFTFETNHWNLQDLKILAEKIS